MNQNILLLVVAGLSLVPVSGLFSGQAEKPAKPAPAKKAVLRAASEMKWVDIPEAKMLIGARVSEVFRDAANMDAARTLPASRAKKRWIPSSGAGRTLVEAALRDARRREFSESRFRLY